MELGEKLRQARLEAGLSQRQLCGDVITRNMLSQIENGSARPSMDTLRYLSAGLGKPVSYFLDEQTVTSANQPVMAAAREAFAAGDGAGAVKALEGYQPPDGVFDQEYGLLLALSLMKLAQTAIGEGRQPYARTLLERAAQAGEGSVYYGSEQERQRLLLLAQASPGPRSAIAARLPEDDRELLIRGEAALEAGDPARCGEILEAAGDKESPGWNLLRGEAYFAQKDYAPAAECYHRAEEARPNETAPRLEHCYRELGDYRQAYFYACKQRKE